MQRTITVEVAGNELTRAHKTVLQAGFKIEEYLHIVVKAAASVPSLRENTVERILSAGIVEARKSSCPMIWRSTTFAPKLKAAELSPIISAQPADNVTNSKEFRSMPLILAPENGFCSITLGLNYEANILRFLLTMASSSEKLQPAV